MSKNNKRQTRKNRCRAGKRLPAKKQAALQARLNSVLNHLELCPLLPSGNSRSEAGTSLSTTFDNFDNDLPISSHGVEREVTQRITRVDEGWLYKQFDIRRKVFPIPNIEELVDELEIIILHFEPEVVTID